MWGISWGGFNAIQVALRRPPALRAIIAVDASDDLFHDDVHYIDGLLHIDEYVLMIDHLNALPPTPDFPVDSPAFAHRFDSEPWLMTWLARQQDGRRPARTTHRGRAICGRAICGWAIRCRRCVVRHRCAARCGFTAHLRWADRAAAGAACDLVGVPARPPDPARAVQRDVADDLADAAPGLGHGAARAGRDPAGAAGGARGPGGRPASAGVRRAHPG
jgi:hypothetical protein